MKEIEILVEVYSPIEEVINILSKFKYLGTKEVVDTYYYDPLRKNLKPNSSNQINECLRLRKKDDTNFITYKIDEFDDDGKWLYSNEYETQINDISVVNNILERLGLKKLITIHNKKRTYKYQEYEIVLETVKDLGYFLEVEFCTNKDIDVKDKKQEIQKFIDSLSLNISQELNIGKPEMMINKLNVKDLKKSR